MRLAFEQLLARFPDMELAGEVQRLASMQFAGIKHMPVRFTPTRARAA
jgi:cytochrome P450